MLVILLVVLVTLAYLVRHFLRRFRYSNKEISHYNSCPTYPHLDPLFGLDLAIQTWIDFNNGELSEGIRKRHLRYGRTYMAKNLGTDCLYTIEPENIRTITTKDFEKFGKSGWVTEASKHVGNGILLNEGEAWKQSRTMLKPIFSRSALDEPALLEPHVRDLVQNMRRLSCGQLEPVAEKGVFDFHELASMFTLDVVTEFLFGRSTGCLKSFEKEGEEEKEEKEQDGKDGIHFLSLVKGFEGPSAQFIVIGPLAWLGLAPSYRHLMGLVDGMKAFFRRKLHDMIADETHQEDQTCGSRSVHKTRTRSQYIPTSVFRSMKEAGASDDQIQGELQNIFFASYDTTSAFLVNLMHVLACWPDVQRTLRKEINTLNGRLPTNTDLSSFWYLRLVIMEALRLFSPVTSHSRTAKVDTVLPRGGGPDGLEPIAIRAGTAVIWSTYSLNRDAQRYGNDWADFRPERWADLIQRPRGTSKTTTSVENSVKCTLDGNDTTGGGGANADLDGCANPNTGENWRDFVMPFGSGPRSCLGQKMVQSEVSYVVVRLLQEFHEITMDRPDTHLGSRGLFKEAKAVSFYSANGVYVSVA